VSPDLCDIEDYLSGTDESVDKILSNLNVNNKWFHTTIPWAGTDPYQSVTDELDPKWAPFYVGLSYYTAANIRVDGHIVVVNGYELTYQGEDNVIYMDPDPGAFHNYGNYVRDSYDHLTETVTQDGLNRYWTETLLTAVTPYPACDISSVQNVTVTSACLFGSINPKGISTTAYFDWGASSSYGNSPAVAQVSGTTSVPVSLTLTGLAPNTTYHYRIRAVNSLYTTKTTDMTFTTAPGFTLTITKKGTGTGTITSSPAGISCGTTCSNSFAAGTAVTLTASPDRGKIFTGWSGACSGKGTCTITTNSAQSVSATFVADITPILNLLLSK
jgi:hypothetical protein